jgi:pimeloyl-ACP methyl ester carboxylesterase
MDLPIMALVLIHGYAETGNIFKDIIPHIHFKQIHNLELPGFGIQPPPQTYSLPAYSDFINSYLLQNNIPSAHFMGHSLGGYILSDFAVKFPSKVQSLTYLHSHASNDSHERKKRRSDIAKALEKHGSEPFLKLFYEGLFKPENIQKSPQTLGELFNLGLNIPTKTLIELQHSMSERPNLVQEIGIQSFPIYFFAGIHDPLIPLEEIKSQSHQMPNSQIIESDSAHMAQFEDSKTLIAHLNSLT